MLSLIPVQMFYTQSPYQYLPKDQVFRPLWHCSLLASSEGIESLLREFDARLLQLRSNAQPNENTEEQMMPLLLELKDTMETTASAVMDRVQLEAGAYQLVAKVFYQPRGGPLRRSVTKFAISSIAFRIAENFREQYKQKLQVSLRQRARRHMIEGAPAYTYPEYQPLDILEE